MRGVSPWPITILIAAVLAAALPLRAQEAPENFRWIDFHSQKDQDVIVWVTRSLDPAKWTAIREIGVQYDAALVVTTLRANPQAPANADTFAVWNVSLTSHAIAPLLKGVNLRWLDWMRVLDSAAPEPAALYDNCYECATETYLTSFHYDFPQHMWMPRWLRGDAAVPVWRTSPTDGVILTQVYAVLTGLDGRQLIATWNHFDYGKQKPPEDFIYRYDVEPAGHLERTQVQTGKEAEALKDRLCHVQDPSPGLARGQDSALCQPLARPAVTRKPVTTPPANNRGQSLPPGVHH